MKKLLLVVGILFSLIFACVVGSVITSVVEETPQAVEDAVVEVPMLEAVAVLLASPTPRPEQEYCNADEVLAWADKTMPLADDKIALANKSIGYTSEGQMPPVSLADEAQRLEDKWNRIDYPPCAKVSHEYASMSFHYFTLAFKTLNDGDMDGAIRYLELDTEAINKATEELATIKPE